MLRTINVTLTEKEFQKLQSAKGKKNWHDFILKLADKKPSSFLPKGEIENE